MCFRHSKLANMHRNIEIFHATSGKFS
jgi:hypothetical protein